MEHGAGGQTGRRIAQTVLYRKFYLPVVREQPTTPAGALKVLYLCENHLADLQSRGIISAEEAEEFLSCVRSLQDMMLTEAALAPEAWESMLRTETVLARIEKILQLGPAKQKTTLSALEGIQNCRQKRFWKGLLNLLDGREVPVQRAAVTLSSFMTHLLLEGDYTDVVFEIEAILNDLLVSQEVTTVIEKLRKLFAV